MNYELGIMGEKAEKIKTFTDLDAWKEGHKLVLMIYKYSECFPKTELFGLTLQLRRCAVSITSNLAEGFSRQYYKEKIQFYSISLGSVTEFQNQTIVARDIKYIGEEVYKNIFDQSVVVHKIINGLIKSSRGR